MSRPQYDHLVAIRQAIVLERSRHNRHMRSLRSDLQATGCDHRAPNGELLVGAVNGVLICAICERPCG